MFIMNIPHLTYLPSSETHIYVILTYLYV